MQQNICFGSNC